MRTFANSRVPPILVYSLNVFLYVLLLGLGVSSIVYTPESQSPRIATFFTDIFGFVVVLGTVGCLYGAARRFYRWEVSFLPLVIGGVLLYAYSFWDGAFSTTEQLMGAFGCTALADLLIIRYVTLLALSSKERTQHELERP